MVVVRDVGAGTAVRRRRGRGCRRRGEARAAGPDSGADGRAGPVVGDAEADQSGQDEHQDRADGAIDRGCPTRPSVAHRVHGGGQELPRRRAAVAAPRGPGPTGRPRRLGAWTASTKACGGGG